MTNNSCPGHTFQRFSCQYLTYAIGMFHQHGQVFLPRPTPTPGGGDEQGVLRRSLSSYPLGKSDSLHPGKWGSKIKPPPPPLGVARGPKFTKKILRSKIFKIFIIFLSISGTPKNFSEKLPARGAVRVCDLLIEECWFFFVKRPPKKRKNHLFCFYLISEAQIKKKCPKKV